MDLPRNSAELAERHSQLSNAIVDVSTEAIHEGRLLLERVSSVDPGADGVRRKVCSAHLYHLLKALVVSTDLQDRVHINASCSKFK